MIWISWDALSFEEETTDAATAADDDADVESLSLDFVLIIPNLNEINSDYEKPIQKKKHVKGINQLFITRPIEWNLTLIIN